MDYVIYIVIGVFLLFLVVGLAIVNFSFEEFADNYMKYDNQIGSYELDVVNFIEVISNNELRHRIYLSFTDKKFGEAFIPGRNTIQLNKDSAYSRSLSSLTVCAHELGHAIQYKNQRQKMQNYFKKLKFSSLFIKLLFPFFLAGVVLFFLPEMNIYYSYACFAMAVFTFVFSIGIKISTLKIEKEASEIAIQILQKYADFDDEKTKDARKLLNSAKNTYLADVLRSLLKWTGLTRG